jgi:hypothetical protein
MTDEEILEIAKQAGWEREFGPVDCGPLNIFAFARLIESKTRDADAMICESTVWSEDIDVYRGMTKRDISVRSMLECAAAIRSQK